MRKTAIIALLAITILMGCDNSRARPGDTVVENLPLLVFSEVLANANLGATWVEILNDGLITIDLEGLELVADSGAEVDFPMEANPLLPQQYLVISIPLLSGPDGVTIYDGDGRQVARLAWPALASAAPGPLFNRSYGITKLGTWRIQPITTPGAANEDPEHAFHLNEVCADNDTSWENPDVPGSYDDWIEIHNPGLIDVDVGGFSLTDDFTNPTLWSIPADTVIPSGGFLVINADERDDLGGLHTPFKLSKSGEELWLYAPGGVLVDAFIYAQMGSDRSRGREYDGAAEWVSFRGATAMGQNHEGVLDPIDDPAHREDDPRFDVVFDESVVKRIDVQISRGDFLRMEKELEEQLRLPADEREYTYVECRVGFGDDVWEHVGVRFKGTSSLQFPYKSGQKKLPIKFDFDEFEDEYPEYLNQRFWGLKKLAFSNGYADPTLLRELLCLKLMRDAGLNASRSAAMEIWVDTGSGPVYWGLYNAIEQVDDFFLEDRFGDDSGNLYKPEGDGADLTEFIEESFIKKTNEDEADFTDVQNLIDVLNADYDTVAEQKAAVEAVVDVPSFIKWLAVNSTLCNFDSYSNRNKNYYLYFHHDTGLCHFITWDHNMAFASVIPFFTAATAHQWSILDPTQGSRPLIDRVLEVPEWNADYRQEVLALLDGDLAEAVMTQRILDLNDLLAPHVIGAVRERAPYTLLLNSGDFDRGVTDLVSYQPGLSIPGLLPFLSSRRAYIESILR